jgi:hypothetical protein
MANPTAYIVYFISWDAIAIKDLSVRTQDFKIQVVEKHLCREVGVDRIHPN